MIVQTFQRRVKPSFKCIEFHSSLFVSSFKGVPPKSLLGTAAEKRKAEGTPKGKAKGKAKAKNKNVKPETAEPEIPEQPEEGWES